MKNPKNLNIRITAKIDPLLQRVLDKKMSLKFYEALAERIKDFPKFVSIDSECISAGEATEHRIVFKPSEALLELVAATA